MAYKPQVLAIADGGTAGNTASAARTALGLAIGSDVQASSSKLSQINSATSGLIRMTLAGVDGKSAGTITTIFTPTSDFVCTGAYARLTTATGIAVVGTLSIGQNGASDDIVTVTALTSVIDTTYTAVLPLIFNSRITPSGSPITVKIGTGYTATTATLSIDVVGYLL